MVQLTWVLTTPFFLEQVEGKSLSSTLTDGLLHFILQKKERRAPEQSRDGPGVMSVFTGRPAVDTHTRTHVKTAYHTHNNNDLSLLLFMGASGGQQWYCSLSYLFFTHMRQSNIDSSDKQ